MVRLLMVFVACLLMACGGPGDGGLVSDGDGNALRAGKADNGDYAQEGPSDKLLEESLAEDGAAEEETVEDEAEVDESHPLIWDGEDVCETAGFYEDDECQDFCPQADPVCPPPEPEPEPVVIDCSDETPECEEGQSIIDTDQNQCGDTCAEPEVDCAVNTDCAEGSYCARAMGECDASVGTCTEIPECLINPETWTPTLSCGCDGYTHGSPCLAAEMGVNIAYTGMCEDEE